MANEQSVSYYAFLADELKSLLETFAEAGVEQGVSDDYEDIREYIDVGEYGLALESLVFGGVEASLAISRETCERIEALSRTMKIFTEIEPLLKKLREFVPTV